MHGCGTRTASCRSRSSWRRFRRSCLWTRRRAGCLPSSLPSTCAIRAGMRSTVAWRRSLQNAVGWDGLTPITGNQNPLYGGNTNRLRKRPGSTSIVMDNPSLPDDHPGAGQMVLTAFSEHARPYERWAAPEQFLRFLEGFNLDRGLAGRDFSKERSHRNAPVTPVGPSPVGTTWNGGLAVPFWLKPGATAQITFAMAWYFPEPLPQLRPVRPGPVLRPEPLLAGQRLRGPVRRRGRRHRLHAARAGAA